MKTREHHAPLGYVLAALASAALVTLLAASGCGDEEVFVTCKDQAGTCSCRATTEKSDEADVDCTKGAHGYCCASDAWPDEGGCDCIYEVSCVLDEGNSVCFCTQFASLMVDDRPNEPELGPVVPITECTSGLFVDDPAVGGMPGCCLDDSGNTCTCSAVELPCEYGQPVETCTADSPSYRCDGFRKVDECATGR